MDETFSRYGMEINTEKKNKFRMNNRGAFNQGRSSSET